MNHARSQGAIGGYVHPVGDSDPFAPENAANPPVLLAVDGILGNMDWLEVRCSLDRRDRDVRDVVSVSECGIPDLTSSGDGCDGQFLPDYAARRQQALRADARVKPAWLHTWKR